MTDPQKLLLKVLSGPHMGAELQLSPGTVIIGRNLNCDVVLHDSAILDHHVRLDLSPTAMALELLDGGAFLDGRWLQQPSKPYQLYQVVSLGTTHLAVGLLDEPWPQIVLPTLEAIQSQANDAVVVEEEGETENAGAVDETAAEHPVAAEAVALENTAPASGRARRRVLALALAGGALSLAGLFFISHGNPSQAAVSRQTNGLATDAGLEQVLAHYRFQSLRLDRGDDGALIIKGVVDEGTEVDALTAALAPFSNQVQLTVAGGERLLDTCRQILRMQALDLEVSAGEANGIVLKGFCTDSSKLAATIQTMQKDVPGLGSVETQVVTPMELTRFLGEKVTELGLGHLVQVGYVDGRMVVAGSLNQHETAHWQQVRAAFTERYGTDLPIVEKITPRTDVAMPLNRGADYGPPRLDVVSISLGRLRYITLSDNRKFFEGAMLDNGFILRSIEADRLVLSRNGHRWVLKPGESS